MGGAHRPSPADLRRPVHRRRRSRDRLRRPSGHTGTDRVLGGGTGGHGHGTDGRVRTGQAKLVVVTAGRRGQEIGQLLIERAVSGAASRGYEYLAVRRPAARNISTIRESYDADFRTRPWLPAPTRRPAPSSCPPTASCSTATSPRSPKTATPTTPARPQARVTIPDIAARATGGRQAERQLNRRACTGSHWL